MRWTHQPVLLSIYPLVKYGWEITLDSWSYASVLRCRNRNQQTHLDIWATYLQITDIYSQPMWTTSRHHFVASPTEIIESWRPSVHGGFSGSVKRPGGWRPCVLNNGGLTQRLQSLQLHHLHHDNRFGMIWTMVVMLVFANFAISLQSFWVNYNDLTALPRWE